MCPPVHRTSFAPSAAAYDSFMGRYSDPLAAQMVKLAPLQDEGRVLDVGCGPGALTAVLASRYGAARVSACDPSIAFVAACAKRCPGVSVEIGAAEHLPYADCLFAAGFAQLVLHFVPEPIEAVRELSRVVTQGGKVVVCVWDSDPGMDMLRLFADAAEMVDPDAPPSLRLMRLGQPDELAALLTDAELCDVVESTVTVQSTYADFDELWQGFCSGIGPAGHYCVAAADGVRAELRAELFRRLGSPHGTLTLDAVARVAMGRRS